MRAKDASILFVWCGVSILSGLELPGLWGAPRWARGVGYLPEFYVLCFVTFVTNTCWFPLPTGV